MDFAKGAIFGMIAGAVIGALNRDEIMSTINMGKREMKKFKKKCSF